MQPCATTESQSQGFIGLLCSGGITALSLLDFFFTTVKLYSCETRWSREGRWCEGLQIFECVLNVHLTPQRRKPFDCWIQLQCLLWIKETQQKQMNHIMLHIIKRKLR